MVEGGVWRRPGPNLRGRVELEGTGRRPEDTVSPGTMRVWGPMACGFDDYEHGISRLSKTIRTFLFGLISAGSPRLRIYPTLPKCFFQSLFCNTNFLKSSLDSILHCT